MRSRILCSIAAATTLAAPASASAAFVHTIAPGESLSSIAAADGLSVSQLAAANGVAPDASLIAGSTVQIPPVSSAAPSSSTTSASTATPTGATGATTDGDGDADDSGAAATTATPTGDGDGDADDAAGSATAAGSSSGSAGAYVVQPGDTLSAIAARGGTSVASLAVANGIDPNAPILSGTVLRLSGGGGGTSVSSTAGSATAASQPVGATAQGSAVGPPYPTPERVNSSQVGSIASANGVPPALADAIGWQESGFNNNLVSSADARGVMQILPGTWDWIQRSLAPGNPLASASAHDNVRGGVLLLHSLLNSTGGDPSLAAAGYYQGLPSVRQNGMYPSTQQYVGSVMALARRFGGL